MFGCDRQEQGNRKVVGELPTVTSGLATDRLPRTHWAMARKRDIESAIQDWSESKIKEAISAEALSSDEAEKLQQYEALDQELGRIQMPRSRSIDPVTGMPVWPDGETNRVSEKDLLVLSARIEQARGLIATVLDRRAREADKIRNQYKPEKLVAEYAGNRFDLVVDSTDLYFSPSRGPILYQSGGEVLDITDGILKLFSQKTKP